MAADGGPAYAERVCANCRARKKKCDKRLPRCGYCAQKALDCCYHYVPHTVSTVSGADSSNIQSVLKHAVNPIMRSSLLLMDSISHTPLSDHLLRSARLDASSSENTLYHQTHRIIRATGQCVDDFCVRYFQGIHHFIPVISQDRIETYLFHPGDTPEADLSILLLSICLLTYDPDIARQNTSMPIDPESLYLTTKSLFTQIHASSQPSLRLIQTGLLLAIYEYAGGKPELAFISVGSCARMAYAAGITHPSNLPAKSLADTELLSEEVNTWWGIIICERIFICEVAVRNQPLASVMPAGDAQLPIEPTAMDQLPTALPISSLTAPNVSGFGRTAQAAWLLDQVLRESSNPDPDSMLIQLENLNSTLQSFLTAVMEQCQGNWGVYCGAIATAIRALFILHDHILGLITQAHSTNPKSESMALQERQDSFRAVLDTVTKMVVDIADSHEHIPPHLLDTLPPSCAYIFRAALGHIRGNGLLKGVSNLWYQSAELLLQRSLGRFSHRWSAEAYCRYA